MSRIIQASLVLMDWAVIVCHFELLHVRRAVSRIFHELEISGPSPTDEIAAPRLAPNDGWTDRLTDASNVKILTLNK